MAADSAGGAENKGHRAKQSGSKHDKKKDRKNGGKDTSMKGKNPKAFTFASTGKTLKAARRSQDMSQKRLHVPQIDRTPLELPPAVIAVVGPPKTGKSTLIRSLVKRYTKHNLKDVVGPVTVVAGKKRRVTFLECSNDLNSMIDVAKVADLVLLLIDASFGFEMETFEFLNILQAHGFPKVMGVLTHLDHFTDATQLKKTKKRLKHRFWTEIYQGAKLFYLSGIRNGKYLKNDVTNLSRFIGVAKFRPLVWRNTHPYVLCDRIEDLTDPEQLRTRPEADREVSVYGYLRGTTLKPDARVHIPGLGDMSLAHCELLPDPCALPEKSGGAAGGGRRTLNDKQRLIYAPMADVGSVVYDRDAVYINVPGNYTRKADLIAKDDDDKDDSSDSDGGGKNNDNYSEEEDEGEESLVKPSQHMMRSMQQADRTIGDMLGAAKLQLFADSAPILPADLAEQQQQQRERRRAVFATPDVSDAESGDEDEDDEDDEQPRKQHRAFRGAEHAENAAEMLQFADSDSEFSNGEDDGDEHVHTSAGLRAWKAGIAERAAERFRADASKVSLRDRIYGDAAAAATEKADNSVGSLFTRFDARADALNALDTTRVDAGDAESDEDEDDEESLAAAIRNRFITGDLDVAGAHANEDGESETGDFEDLEQPPSETERDEQAKKAALKAKFDAEYDDKFAGEDDAEAEAGDVTEDGKRGRRGIGGDDSTFYDEMKAQLGAQQTLNRAAFADMDERARAQVEGFRPGSYVRAVLRGVPCELVQHFDGRYPLILGGLLPNEDNYGFLRARVKKHRWRKKVLKSSDPLVFSVGWRRFQSLPIYSLDDRVRNRLLKYTPEHMHCVASFYGPMTPPNTGFCAFQSVGNDTAQFRVAATGTITDVDKSAAVVKKLKLTGTPYKIHRNTAFVRDMFSSALEVSKFVNASIRTVSGIRGQVKKAEAKPEGAFRATFEDKILASDIVFLKAWYPVRPKKFYTTVTSLLLADKTRWEGMRTARQLRLATQTALPSKADSAYRPVTRGVRRFNPLRVPASLQQALPFAAKPKVAAKRTAPTYATRRAVVMEPEERRAHELMQQLRTVQRDKDARRKEAKRASQQRHLHKKALDADRRAPHDKEARRDFFAKRDKDERRKEAAQSRVQSRGERPVKRRKTAAASAE